MTVGTPFAGTHAPDPTLNGSPWHEANRQHLYDQLEVLRLELALVLHEQPENAQSELEPLREHAAAAVRRSANELRGRSSLNAVVELFALTEFEANVLLLAAGSKLIPGFPGCYAAGTHAGKLMHLSFELAFRGLKAPHWTAIAPTAPLRAHHLIELEHPDDPVQSPLRIDERLLHFLLGVATLDARLHGVLEPVHATAGALPAAYAGVARQLGALWANRNELPIVQLAGPDLDGKRAIASSASAQLAHQLYIVRGADLQCEPSQRVFLARLIERELVLAGAALLVIVDDDDAEEARAARALIGRLRTPIAVARRDPLPGLMRREARLDLQPLDPPAQRALWRACLGRELSPLSVRADETLDAIVGHFRFGPTAIRSTALALIARDEREADAESALWELCRRRGRSRLSDLAQHIDSSAAWDDLILPEPQRQVLKQIAQYLVHKTLVHEHWGFGRSGARGLGLTALFAGESGTGKTLAAEVIANHVRLDLWRIDVSRMLDKYIGETEKNLRRIFDAAEESGAILLFDEADALFSKRTEVKDSVDRFTNVEISYLLQRMESYGGLAILTTNMRSAIDSAFLRRIRFVVQFPFPRAEQRAQIWRRAFPAAAPTADLNMGRLAQLNLAGGNIRNIALNAAFFAAGDRRPIGMEHLLYAARNEYAKLERTLADSEIAGWL